QVVGDKRFVYDGLDLIADLNKFDQVVASYTNGLGIDDPLIMRWNGNDYFYHKNHLGSVTMITDDEGEDNPLAKTYQYDAYGNVLSASGSLAYNPFLFTGRERHVASGLYYYRARWYDPQLGRFMNQDPIGDLGGLNLYAYVGNDPVSRIDPLGLEGLFSPLALSPQLGSEIGEAFSESIDYYHGMYERAHEIRSQAQQNFPDVVEDDFPRHYTASYQLAEEYGTGNARLAGIANEVQGLLLYDTRLFLHSLFGNRPFAFSLTDLYVNEMAFEDVENKRANRCLAAQNR
ncbi:MAG: RHS repeat-associated core domain-containing protein, partial [Candidatus Abyssobacteria bacterium SURF_17]